MATGNGWFDVAGDGGHLEVSAVLDSGVLDTIVRLVGTGALVSLGTTRDGGAVGCTVTYDSKWRREYFRDGEALSEWLDGALTHLAGLGLATGDPLAASQRPGRRAQKAPRDAARG